MPFVVSTDVQELANRVSLRNIPVEIRVLSPQPVTDNARQAPQTPPHAPFSMRLVAEIASPVVGGISLRATDVKLGTDTAVVSYNLEGEKALGALESIDLSDISHAKITTQITYPGRDINGVAVVPVNKFSSQPPAANCEADVYFVGASSGSASSPAFINRAQLVQKHLVPWQGQDLPLGSFAGTSVASLGDTLIATSGNTGSVTYVDRKTFKIKSQIPLHDARSAAALPGENVAAVLSGTPGLVRLYSRKGQAGSGRYLNGARTPESKSTVVAAGDLLVNAIGEGGTDIVCAQDGKLLLHINQVTVPSLPAAKTVTNSVAVWNNVLFTASGEAGIYAYNIVRSRSSYSKCGAMGGFPIGSLTLGGAGFSANHVVAGKNTLLAADGVGGLKVLTLNQP